MKKMKNLLSFVLALVMVMAMGMTAMASSVSSEEDTVTVTLPSGELLQGHDFYAYQLFSGTQGTTEDSLGDVEWGSGINGETFLAALKELDFGTAEAPDKPFADCKTAKDVSEVLAEKKTDASGTETREFKLSEQQLEKIARLALGHLSKDNKVKLVSGNNPLPMGYYLIVDETDVEGQDKVRNASLLQATKNIEIRVKTDKPDVKKKIVEGTDRVDFNQAPMGGTVKYELSSKVPDMSHYMDYKFVMSDLLSKGLTFSNDVVNPDGTTAANTNIKIKIGTKDLTYDTDFEVVVMTAAEAKTRGYIEDEADSGKEYEGGTYIRIIFKNFYENYNDETYKNADITVTYEVTVNENAVVGVEGNPNEVKLQYSNNPDEVGEGDDFGDSEPKGEIPWDQVRTFETALELTKVDGKTNAPLAGAQFKVTGTALKKALVSGYEFVVKSGENTGVDGKTYYLLKDGSYTATAPSATNTDKYADTTTQYIKVSKEATELSDVSVNFVAEVGADGKLTLKGLSEGEYIIEEIKAPNGYNLLTHPIKVVITGTLPTGDGNDPGKEITWAGTYGIWDESTSEYIAENGKTTNDLTFDGSTGVLSFNVANNRGAVLPETGGIGTTIFYVAGMVLVIVAGVLLVTKKRMSKEQ